MSEQSATSPERPGAQANEPRVVRARTETTDSTLCSLFELARGGMGRVELALLRGGGFERIYAVKRLHPHYQDDAQLRSSFMDEARIAGLLRHPNVVSVLDVGEDDEGPFLLMDYVEGVALSSLIPSLIAGGIAELSVCCELIRQAALGLHAAHELRGHDGAPLSLIHRDVSPQNILVSATGRVALTDFGIAKALGNEAKTATGFLKGKVAYMSPEQLGFRSLTRSSDLFSLGVVLFELLAGRRLYGPVEMPATAQRILYEPPPDLAEFRRDAPPELVHLLFRLLAKEPKDRPATALEVAQLLRPYAGEPEEVAEAVQETQGERLDAQRARIREAMQALPAQRRAPKRPLFALGALGLAVLAGWWAMPASPHTTGIHKVNPAPEAAPREFPIVQPPEPDPPLPTVEQPEPAPAERPTRMRARPRPSWWVQK